MAKKQQMSFGTFQVGDHAIFPRTFVKADFKTFSKLSGDANPLHGDARYAAKSEFGRAIVPVHMTMSPMSMIAGMVMPGDPSLYLGHEVHALKPVFFDEEITYSARITAINTAERILEINTIAFREDNAEVVMRATMRVQSRIEEWQQTPSPVTLAPRTRTALVSGANGAIGSAVAKRLAGEGWGLILHHRGPAAVIKGLRDACKALGAAVTVCSADISTAKGQAKVTKLLSERADVEAFVHTASAPVLAEIEQHTPVSYNALKAMANAVLPHMLGRQRGRVISIGSTAMHQPPAGWEDYAAAKGMAANYLSGLDKKYAINGVHGVTVAPGYVLSAFSDSLRPEGVDALLPEEVAEQVADLAGADDIPAPYVLMTSGMTRVGRYDFRDQAFERAAAPVVQASPSSVHAAPTTQQKTSNNLATFVRDFLKLPADYDLGEAALGETPGWDSLRHLELILALEKEFTVSFTSGEIEKTHLFATLERVWVEKTGS